MPSTMTTGKLFAISETPQCIRAIHHELLETQVQSTPEFRVNADFANVIGAHCGSAST